MATTTRQLADFIVEGGVQDIAVQQNPHIQPGTLQPAVAGKLLDGTTNHSGAYGTAQSDGHSYYYTDIKGSRPIKDPRIGAHFGSQRHKCQSLKKLEQESATHGDKVYSIDGREWCRAVGSNWVTHNGPYGVGLEQSGSGGATDTQYIEIVGYFNDVNVLHYLAWVGSNDMHRVSVNGGTVQSTDLSVGVVTPLGGRYVQAHSLVNLTFNSAPTLGINTLKIANTNGHYINLGGAELIAQDTTSLANKSKIQIPAQTVVSYGKKFSVSAAAHHYDPFNGFTNSSHLHSTYVDTATSLGLDTAPGSSAKWAISNTNNIRPYNGGRVVKWIASDGTIKTSVNMMPPNAQSVDITASNEITTPSATNTTTTPNFSDDGVDLSQAEIAKTFNWREFGNGNANAGGVSGGTGGNYKDFSMFNGSTSTDLGFVMDDGLTAMGGDDCKVPSSTVDHTQGTTTADGHVITWIGTGITINADTTGPWVQVAQNLPYGTHMLKYMRNGDNVDIALDGVDFGTVNVGTAQYGKIHEITFYQPKMPPVPEDACIIADYMLMADHVVTVDGTVNSHRAISRGCRRVYSSRDSFYVSGTFTIYTHPQHPATGPYWYSNGTQHVKIPAFATNAIQLNYASVSRGRPYQIDGSTVTSTKVGNGDSSLMYAATPATLETHTFGTNGSGTSSLDLNGWDIVTPTHTSSHYQTFENPYLKELVGGDRNMEQTNLVVTSDGKTWDEVTRDTSYIGKGCFSCWTSSTRNADANTMIVMDEFRGVLQSYSNFYQKDFAIAYDKYICLVGGQYAIKYGNYHGYPTHIKLYINGTRVKILHRDNPNSGDTGATYSSWTTYLKRGDYVQMEGGYGTNNDAEYGQFQIERV